MAFKNKFYVTDAGISWQHRCYAQFRVPVNMSTGKCRCMQLSYLRRCCIRVPPFCVLKQKLHKAIAYKECDANETATKINGRCQQKNKTEMNEAV